jgi:glycosyltransferase involved in cell wall biosynthesis
MHSSKKILIISHDANLNGAPILLLRLMKILKEHGYSFNTILRKGGPLVNEFRALSDVCGYFRRTNGAGFISKLNSRLRGRTIFDISAYTSGIDLVLSNTITNGEIIKLLRENYEGPIITYVHELKMGEALYSTPALVDLTIKMTDHFLVPSLAVKQHLQTVQGISERQISPLNYYIPVEKESVPSFAIANNGSDRFIVGGMGTIGWRKGTDIFVLVAATLFKKMPGANIQFVWMGAHHGDTENSKLNYDIEKLGLREKVVIINASEDTSAFFQNVSLLLLPSREDPYPLVVLEAAAKKIPTVCFEHAGGAPEFVQDEAGTIIPYLDTDTMTEAVLRYYCDKEFICTRSNNAFYKVKRLHQDKKFIVDQFNKVLKKFTCTAEPKNF